MSIDRYAKFISEQARIAKLDETARKPDTLEKAEKRLKVAEKNHETVNHPSAIFTDADKRIAAKKLEKAKADVDKYAKQ